MNRRELVVVRGDEEMERMNSEDEGRRVSEEKGEHWKKKQKT